MPDARLWANIPDALKTRRQWCVSNPNDPDVGSRKAPRIARTFGALASVQKPENWSTFREAALFAYERNWNIGYVISKEDNVCCVDLDVKGPEEYPNEPIRWTTSEEIDRHKEFIERLDSYTELSANGKGWHVWVHASTGQGAKHNHVEIYSQERYIICTGNVVKPIGLSNRQELIEASVAQIRELQGNNEKIDLVEIPQVLSDEDLWSRALQAANSKKFIDLCKGDWQSLGYKSQSEADLALLSIFTFYSKSNEQCRRLFRLTELGRRKKAAENNRYLDETLKLIRARQDAQDRIELSLLERQAEKVLKAAQAAAAAPAIAPAVRAPAPAPVAPVAPAIALPAGNGTITLPPLPEGQLEWPPGLVGEIAKYIFDNAPRPVKEVAIVSALGLMAGIVGLGWTLPQTGLNLYVILVGRSAVGKEAMHTGISSIVSSVMRQNPLFSFTDFNDYASGPALQKAVARNRCFVSVSGEWGHTLQKLAESDHNPTASSLRRVMTHLYQKSGPGSMVGGITYSNKEENISSVDGVAFSLIGETTPAKYYDSLTQSMMEDGFLSRFTMVEYTGDRPKLKADDPLPPSEELTTRIAELSKTAIARMSPNGSIRVQRDEDARILFALYDEHCDNEINKTPDNEAWRQMWNRAHLKALRIAAILAVCDNDTNPIITMKYGLWAIDLINRDIELMKRKFNEGDIGNNDATRERKIMALCKDYLVKPLPDGFALTTQMKKNAVITRQFLQTRTSNYAAFYKHPIGATRAMELTIKSLCESGKLKELDRKIGIESYGHHGKLYQILTLE